MLVDLFTPFFFIWNLASQPDPAEPYSENQFRTSHSTAHMENNDEPDSAISNVPTAVSLIAQETANDDTSNDSDPETSKVKNWFFLCLKILSQVPTLKGTQQWSDYWSTVQ